MLFSYKRPADRPSKIYCRTCEKYKISGPNQNGWPPKDLGSWYCGNCGSGSVESMVYDLIKSINYPCK